VDSSHTLPANKACKDTLAYSHFEVAITPSLAGSLEVLRMIANVVVMVGNLFVFAEV